MTNAKNAPSGATESLALEKAAADLITIHRDALQCAIELLEEGMRQQFGWQTKETAPMTLAKLLFRASRRPDVEYPGLGDIIDAYDMMTTIAATPAVNDSSPEGIARLRLASRRAR
ncbi:hypothetical protein [Devosia salina]|uniref:Uncharacterized protein n=1 Tax=Devosia salina TaxID=2860336 RepID=A0ABX8WK56_9HYPH|nr:hypothetical protein [Devosia salina]QYO78394.1 hypothetical protein K1X15_07565 [Devosia salina]